MPQSLLYIILVYLPYGRYGGDMIIPDGKCIEDAQNRDAEQHLPRTVRNLRSRWSPGMNFGEFSQKTFEAFY